MLSLALFWAFVRQAVAVCLSKCLLEACVQKYPIHLNRWTQSNPYKAHLRKKKKKKDFTLESLQNVCLGIEEDTPGEINFCLVLSAWLTVPH